MSYFPFVSSAESLMFGRGMYSMFHAQPYFCFEGRLDKSGWPTHLWPTEVRENLVGRDLKVYIMERNEKNMQEFRDWVWHHFKDEFADNYFNIVKNNVFSGVFRFDMESMASDAMFFFESTAMDWLGDALRCSRPGGVEFSMGMGACADESELISVPDRPYHGFPIVAVIESMKRTLG